MSKTKLQQIEPRHILGVQLFDQRIHIDFIDPSGRPSFLNPTADRFGQHCESLGEHVADPVVFILSLDEDRAAQLAAGYLNAVAGMDSYRAYELGYCSSGATPGGAPDSAIPVRVATSQPEDEHNDSAHLGFTRSAVVAAIRPSFSPIQYR